MERGRRIALRENALGFWHSLFHVQDMERIEDSPSYQLLERLARKQKPSKPRASVPIDVAAAELDDMIETINEFRRNHAASKRTHKTQ